MTRPTLFVIALTLAAPGPAAAQHDHGGEGAADSNVRETVPLFRAALGPFSRRITTTSPEAQAYFDQGMQMMYAFTPRDAARSFQEALRRDPGCAMCAWGEAWAYGAYLNEPMRPENAAPAHAAVTRARALARTRATEVERAMIEALAARYEPRHDVTRRRALDSAWARAMERVAQRFPDDLDVATLHAEALMLLEPRRGVWDMSRPQLRRIHELLEAILARDLDHPGACHLFIHATETTPRAAAAEPCADRLGAAIPGASHINHMPSHTYNRVGRWGDAVRANVMAWHSDQRAAIGEGFSIYPTHNLHMLLFAASMDGQGALAIQAGHDYAKITGGQSFLQALAMVRFGRWNEILRLPDSAGNAVARGLGAFARGYAHLRLGNADSAAWWAARVDSLARNSPTARFRFHPAERLLGVTRGILRGEILRAAGDLAGAIASFERAVALEDSLEYDEPEPLNFSARHWLGAALLEAGRAGEADAVYRAALEDHPANGWSLFGLMQAQRSRGDEAAALSTRAAFDRAWARSDVWLRASRF
jgi:tetratricopeptide (TPR) repeat protein